MGIKISGCINACGHHHVGHIGILGLDRAGVENYQITLGGDATETAEVGSRVGPGFSYEEILPALERLIAAYLALRETSGETFLETYRRLGDRFLERFRQRFHARKDRRRSGVQAREGFPRMRNPARPENRSRRFPWRRRPPC